jgi:hypothetical protein
MVTSVVPAYAFNPEMGIGHGITDDEHDVHYFVVDSGSNMNFVCESRILTNPVPSSVTVTGVGSDQIQAELDGQMLGYLQDEGGGRHGVNAVGTYLPGMFTSLFSVSRAAQLGHTVIHEGHPTTGRHGMTLAGTNAFVPFIWSPATRLWYLPFYRCAEPKGAANHA